MAAAAEVETRTRTRCWPVRPISSRQRAATKASSSGPAVSPLTAGAASRTITGVPGPEDEAQLLAGQAHQLPPAGGDEGQQLRAGCLAAHGRAAFTKSLTKPAW